MSTIALPVMFYVLFGIAFAGGEAGGVGVTTYMLATYGTFGVIGAALFGFGVSVAMERGQGWMRLKRVSPMPPQAYFVAKVVMSTTVSALIIGALFILGATLGGVRMPAAQWISLGLVLILGALPFSAMGLAFGYVVGPNSAPAMLNLIYLPMAFASGLWIPIHAAARVRPGDRSRTAALPLRSARPRYRWRRRERISGTARRRAASVHRVLPDRGRVGLPARRGPDLRMRRT